VTVEEETEIMQSQPRKAEQTPEMGSEKKLILS
jgi:hypothetical protein